MYDFNNSFEYYIKWIFIDFKAVNAFRINFRDCLFRNQSLTRNFFARNHLIFNRITISTPPCVSFERKRRRNAYLSLYRTVYLNHSKGKSHHTIIDTLISRDDAVVRSIDERTRILMTATWLSYLSTCQLQTRPGNTSLRYIVSRDRYQSSFHRVSTSGSPECGIAMLLAVSQESAGAYFLQVAIFRIVRRMIIVHSPFHARLYVTAIHRWKYRPVPRVRCFPRKQRNVCHDLYYTAVS